MKCGFRRSKVARLPRSEIVTERDGPEHLDLLWHQEVLHWGENVRDGEAPSALLGLVSIWDVSGRDAMASTASKSQKTANTSCMTMHFAS